MNERARANPVQYVDVTDAVLAGLVIEWSVVRDEAMASAKDPVATADVTMTLVETCQAWSRRRGLGAVTPAAAIDDAGTYLLEHELSAAQRQRLSQKMWQVVDQQERTKVLLRKLGRG